MAGNASRMKLGTAPISWGVCELPDWGVMLPYQRVLDEMADLGYVGTELGPWGSRRMPPYLGRSCVHAASRSPARSVR